MQEIEGGGRKELSILSKATRDKALRETRHWLLQKEHM